MRRISAFFLVLAIMVSCLSFSALAAENTAHGDLVRVPISDLVPVRIDSDSFIEPPAYTLGSAGYIGIADYTWTTIYTGNGKDRWIHISPWVTPNTIWLKMTDYNNTVVWNRPYDFINTRHFFVGANVKKVEAMGFPGGSISVTDTAH